MDAIKEFSKQLQSNRDGRGGVAVSVCSAHPMVLRAAFRAAKKHDTFALIESTSNQVDQYGGYTGMTPADFSKLVREIALEEAFPIKRILLGGDHLGPNSWRHLGSERAMQETSGLIESYVKAGFRKIHLDASFVCAGDKGPLNDEIVAERCADMAQVAEAASGSDKPIYIVGTEVPTPGGVQNEERLHITTPAEVEKTISVFRDTFKKRGLESALERVVGLVIQPGVEFGDSTVHDFKPVPALSKSICGYPGMVYEAHSTDYQSASNLTRLAQHHFFVLKVGPWLTYALREGLFALELSEKELGLNNPSNLRAVLSKVMTDDPRHWEKYYSGTEDEIRYKLAFSYSDRSRYYLGHRDVRTAVESLFGNLRDKIPDGLISQYMTKQYQSVREGYLSKDPAGLAIEQVCNVLDMYHQAGEQQERT